MRIFIASDHNGFRYKADLIKFLTKLGHEAIDSGDTKMDPTDDFPKFASQAVIRLLGSDPSDRAILICGSGQGMCMAANRYKGIRASLCFNIAEAKDVRNDDDSNVLCLSARQTNLQDMELIITAWLNTPFAGASRFVRRLQELDSLG